MANVLTNLFNVATGSGAHEKAMREYLNPFKGGQNYNISQGPVADYMSGYLKDYVNPTNQAGGTWKDGVMSVMGLGKGGDPFTKEGLAIAANLSSDPSFQAENLFGQGTLRRTPSGYEYTGGKFDFNFEPGSSLGWFEKNILQPSEYKMSFDKDFNPFNPRTRFKQQQLMNQRKQDMQQRIRQAEAAETNRIAKEKADAARAEQTRQAQLQAQVTSQANREAKRRISQGEGRDYGKTETRASSGWESSPFNSGGLVNFYRYGGFI